MTRTDVHSPTNLVTEDYDFVGCGSYGSYGEPGYSPVAPGQSGSYLIDEGWKFGENPSPNGGCYHCGAHIKYYAVLKHLPTKQLIIVGETCLDNRFGRATREFQALRKQAQLDREQQRIKIAREAWQAEHPTEFEFLADANEAYQSGGRYDDFYASLWRTLSRYGELSERQLAALQRSIDRDAQRQQERAAREANEPAPSPVVEGKVTITGEILATKVQDSMYGSTLKMLVRDDRGFKVWGTVPSSIDQVAKHQRVTFSATVERSQDDECFGFFKRPTKASILATEGEDEGCEGHLSGPDDPMGLTVYCDGSCVGVGAAA